MWSFWSNLLSHTLGCLIGIKEEILRVIHFLFPRSFVDLNISFGRSLWKLKFSNLWCWISASVQRDLMGKAHHREYITHFQRGMRGGKYIWWQNSGGQINPQTFPDHNNPQQMMPDAHVCSMRTVALMETIKATEPWSLFPAHWFTGLASATYLCILIARTAGEPLLNLLLKHVKVPRGYTD